MKWQVISRGEVAQVQVVLDIDCIIDEQKRDPIAREIKLNSAILQLPENKLIFFNERKPIDQIDIKMS